jgi:hypothetical protein
MYDQGLVATVIHVLKWSKCHYYFGPLQTAVNLFFGIATAEELEALNAETDYYQEVHAAIEKQHRNGDGMSIQDIMLAAGLDPEVGLTEFRTACELRWGSVPHASGELFPVALVMLLGLLRRFTFGTLASKVKAACAIVSFIGFVQSEHPGLKVEVHAQRVWAFFNRTQDLLQIAVMRFVYNMVVRLFLKYASDELNTGTLAMMGLNGVVRNVLRVLSRDIWVKIHGSRLSPKKLRNGRVVNEWIANGDGWGRKMASPFKTNGSEFAGQPSLRLLNPHCGSRVQHTLNFAADAQTLNATRELVHALVTLAKRDGPALPEDISKALGSASDHRRAQYADASNINSFPVKMSQMQEFVYLASRDAREAMETQMQRELYDLKGTLAGMTETVKTSFFRYARQPESTEVPANEQFILKASCMAIANAVATKIGIRDINAFMQPQLNGKDISDFLPTWGKAVSKECEQDMDKFIGISKQGEWGRNFDIASDLPPIEGCPPGANSVDGQREFTWPLQRFNNSGLCRACWIARSTMGNSKPAEGGFSTPAAMIKTKGRATFPTIVHLTRRLYWTHTKNQGFLDRVAANENIFWAASWIGRLGGWRKVFNKDQVTADVMHDNFVQQDPKQIPASIKQGKGWKETNFVSESRTAKFSKPKPGSEEDRRMTRLMSTIAARLDPLGGIGAEIPRDVLRGTQAAAKEPVDLQKVARRVRRRMNSGQAACPVSKATVSTPRDTLSCQVSGRRRNVATGRGRALPRVHQNRRLPAGAGRGGRACHGKGHAGGEVTNDCNDALAGDGGASAVKTARPCKRRRCMASGADGDTDTDSEFDGDSLWSPEQLIRQDSGSAPIRATRARAAAALAPDARAAAPPTAAMGDARESPDGPAPDATSPDSASDSAVSPPAAVAAAAAVGDAVTSTNPALRADVQMTSSAAGSLSDLDEDIPLANRKTHGAKRQCSERSNCSEDESEEEEEEDFPALLRGAKVWSVDYAMAFHNWNWDDSKADNCPWNLGKVVIDKDSKAISITRTAKYKPKQMKADPTITFHAEVDDEKHLQVMFDNFAGAMLVSVTGISKTFPKSQTAKDWSNTVKFRRAYTSSEAVNRTDKKMNTIRKNFTYLGEAALQKYADETNDAVSNSITYHIGDCEYKGDIRRLIGIVRKFPEAQRFYQDDGFGASIYPFADKVFVGPCFSEKSS